MQHLRDGALNFRNAVFPDHAGRFDELANGQSPEVMFITCADSRIDPSLITQTLPGDLFVVRNAGNFVQPVGDHGTAEAAAVEYAVRVLGVGHIVICGHSQCGAVSAALTPPAEGDLPEVVKWLRDGGPDLAGADPDDVTGAVENNVRQQLDNLRTHPAVAEAEAAGKLQLHGWVYHFETGVIHELDPASGSFREFGNPTVGDGSAAVT